MRDPTRTLDVWDMDPIDLIIVNIDEYGQSIDEEGTNLTRFIGIMVWRKQYASIEYIFWKIISVKEKEDMLKLIEIL